MFADSSEEPGVNEQLVKILQAIAFLLSAADLDDSGQARRDLRRATNIIVRIAARAAARSQRDSAPSPESLSHTTLGPRENAIARLLAEGKSYKDIAVLLGMGLSSVGTRVKTVYLKLGVHSRVELQQRMLASSPSPALHAQAEEADEGGSQEPL